MSSTPPLAAWLGTPPKEKPTNGRVHILQDDDELPADPATPAITPFVAGDANGDPITAKGGNTMPRGIYDRKKRASTEAPGEAAEQTVQGGVRGRGKRRKIPGPGRQRAPKVDTSSPRFGVFDDGSVHVNTTSCRGVLTAGEATDLLAFIGKLRTGKDAKR